MWNLRTQFGSGLSIREILTSLFHSRILAGLLLSQVAFGAISDEAIAKEKIRIGAAVSWPNYSLFELARAKNLAPDYDLEITILEDPVGGQNLLSTGQIDILLSTPDYAPIAVANNLDVVNVAFLALSYGADQIVLAPGVEPAQLPGKKVSAPDAFIGQIVMGLWLEQQGIDFKSVTWVNLNADQAVGPIIAKDIAAAHMYEPWTAKLLESVPGARVVTNSSQENYTRLGMLGDSIFMNRKFVQEKRKAAVDMLALHWKAVQLWHDDPRGTNAFLAKFLKWPEADVEFVMGTNGKSSNGGLYVYDFDQSARFCGVLDGEPPFKQKNGGYYDAMSETNRLWVKLGVLKKPEDAKKGLDCSLMGDLVKSGFRQAFDAVK
jgi:NitT/TauT family transport system substrate-binding protein